MALVPGEASRLEPPQADMHHVDFERPMEEGTSHSILGKKRSLCRRFSRCIAGLCERLNTLPFWPALGYLLTIVAYLLFSPGLESISGSLKLILPNFNLALFVNNVLAFLNVTQLLMVERIAFYKCIMHSGLSCCNRRMQHCCGYERAGCFGSMLVHAYKYLLSLVAWAYVPLIIALVSVVSMVTISFISLFALCEGVRTALDEFALQLDANRALADGVPFVEDVVDTAVQPIDDVHHTVRNFVDDACSRVDDYEAIVLMLIGAGLSLLGQIIVLVSYVTTWEVHVMYTRGDQRLYRRSESPPAKLLPPSNCDVVAVEMEGTGAV